LNCQSIKCSQCGKIFKNTALANFHAEKSGHDQFEESTEDVRFSSLCTTGIDDALKIKPLTEEEKKQKLAELREKMTEKRARKAAEEAKEVKANELIRRKAGKVRTLLDRTPRPALLPPPQPTNRCSHIINRKPRRSKRISRTSRSSKTSKKSAAVRLLPLPSHFPPISHLPVSPPSDVVIITSPLNRKGK
jgi:hypothetical protein